MPTEANDHRYGLKDYALTYSGLYIMENVIRHDAPGMGAGPATVPTRPGGPGQGAGGSGSLPSTGSDAGAFLAPLLAAGLIAIAVSRRRRAHG